MKKLYFAVLLVVVGLLGLRFLESDTVAQAQKASKGQGDPPKQWEYKTFETFQVRKLAPNGSDLTEGLNKLGSEGWELVTVTEVQEQPRVQPRTTFYFKRPK